MAKKTPEVNSSSMADIAFLMLAFFLMVSTMDQDKGISRRLPPMPPPGAELQDQKVNKRNIILVRISSSNNIYAGNQGVDISQLKDKIVEFLTNPNNDPNMPDKEMTDIPGFGTYPVSQGVISLQNDRETNYDAYIQVQNELIRAVNQLRDEFSMANFGKKFSLLTNDAQSKIVRDAIPQIISEAEPKDVSKKK